MSKQHHIRSMCNGVPCRWNHEWKIKQEAPIMRIGDYGEWSVDTGWYGDIECPVCGKRVAYVASRAERKNMVERKLRKMWEIAKEVD